MRAAAPVPTAPPAASPRPRPRALLLCRPASASLGPGQTLDLSWEWFGASSLASSEPLSDPAKYAVFTVKTAHTSTTVMFCRGNRHPTPRFWLGVLSRFRRRANFLTDPPPNRQNQTRSKPNMLECFAVPSRLPSPSPSPSAQPQPQPQAPAPAPALAPAPAPAPAPHEPRHLIPGALPALPWRRFACSCAVGFLGELCTDPDPCVAGRGRSVRPVPDSAQLSTALAQASCSAGSCAQSRGTAKPPCAFCAQMQTRHAFLTPRAL